MVINTEYVTTKYSRYSKLGILHTYYRNKTIVVFRCDSCGLIFTRDKGQISPKRLTNQYYHVCNQCNPKKFAQEKGVESRKIWDMPVSRLKSIAVIDK